MGSHEMFLSKRMMWSESIREGNILCLVSHLERPGGRGTGQRAH